MNPKSAQAFVLHTRSYRETSLLVTCFTMPQGLLHMIAKGAKRPRSTLRGVLQPFCPLRISFSEKKELRTLFHAEALDCPIDLTHRKLICGFYLNELLVKLLPKEQAYESLFDLYQKTLRALSHTDNLALPLRQFEYKLIALLGYKLPLTLDVSRNTLINPKYYYAFNPEAGPSFYSETLPNNQAQIYSGELLLGLAEERFEDPQILTGSKQLLRQALAVYLHGKSIKTKEIMW